MHIVYSSPQYHIIEYPTHNAFELVNRGAQQAGVIQGQVADVFRVSLNSLIGEQTTADQIDLFLSQFDGLMAEHTVYH